MGEKRPSIRAEIWGAEEAAELWLHGETYPLREEIKRLAAAAGGRAAFSGDRWVVTGVTRQQALAIAEELGRRADVRIRDVAAGTTLRGPRPLEDVLKEPLPEELEREAESAKEAALQRLRRADVAYFWDLLRDFEGWRKRVPADVNAALGLHGEPQIDFSGADLESALLAAVAAQHRRGIEGWNAAVDAARQLGLYRAWREYVSSRRQHPAFEKIWKAAEEKVFGPILPPRPQPAPPPQPAPQPEEVRAPEPEQRPAFPQQETEKEVERAVVQEDKTPELPRLSEEAAKVPEVKVPEPERPPISLPRPEEVELAAVPEVKAPELPRPPEAAVPELKAPELPSPPVMPKPRAPKAKRLIVPDWRVPIYDIPAAIAAASARGERFPGHSGVLRFLKRLGVRDPIRSPATASEVVYKALQRRYGIDKILAEIALSEGRVSAQALQAKLRERGVEITKTSARNLLRTLAAVNVVARTPKGYIFTDVPEIGVISVAKLYKKPRVEHVQKYISASRGWRAIARLASVGVIELRSGGRPVKLPKTLLRRYEVPEASLSPRWRQNPRLERFVERTTGKIMLGFRPLPKDIVKLKVPELRQLPKLPRLPPPRL